MAVNGSDPFGKLSPEIRLQVLTTTRCKSTILRLIEASPIMLQQYCVHKKYVVRQILAAEFDDQMIQDAMAVILFPPIQNPSRVILRRSRAKPINSHITAWVKSELPHPLKERNDQLMNKLNKLHSRILVLAEDYITKATSTIPPWAYSFLPDIRQPSAQGHLMFKGVKISSRFNFANLTSLERKRFVKAFLKYELLCKANSTFYIPYYSPTRKVSNAEWEAVGCIHRYFCSLYGALFAQCTDAELSSLSTELRFPDTFYFDANRHIPKLGLNLTDPPERRQGPEFEFRLRWPSEEYPDSASYLSLLGLDYLTKFLNCDMAELKGRDDLRAQLENIWSNNCLFGRGGWEEQFCRLFNSERGFKDKYDSFMYKELSLSPGSAWYKEPSWSRMEKLRYKIGQQRAWVFFDDNYFYPQETSERPNFPSVGFLEYQPRLEYIRQFSEDYRRGRHPWQRTNNTT